MCPFCYIGKRKFEKALEQFAHHDCVEIIWKSFQLDSSLKTDTNTSIDQMLADKKGWTLERATQMNDYVSDLARQVGLNFRLDQAIVANSFDAHRLSHLAKKQGVQNQAEEALFLAYFTHGKNTADHATLVQLGKEIGLDSEEVQRMLSGKDLSDEVRKDLHEAQQIGVTGVPFFVINRKYAVSGAQESSLFLQTLNQAWTENEKLSINADHETGAVCNTESWE